MPRTAGGGRTTVALGDLVSEQHVEVVLRLNFPFGELGLEVAASFALTDRDGVLASDSTASAKLTPGGHSTAAARPVTLTWAYADDRTNDLQERDSGSTASSRKISKVTGGAPWS